MARLPDHFPALPLTKGVTGDNYFAPPFSVLDGRAKAWQARKKAWISGFDLAPAEGRDAKSYTLKRGKGNELLKAEADGISVFDPVLAETFYQWFAPAGGFVLDPFGGDIGRGYTAAKMGLHFTGLELRGEQVSTNNAKVPRDCTGSALWIEGDAADTLAARKARRGDAHGSADLLIACPPYGPLERYSDHPKDLSNMGREAFLRMYKAITKAAADELKPDSFAVYVVGDYRLPDGSTVSMVKDTWEAFAEAGITPYNIGVYLTPLGTAPVRINASFLRGKGKLGRVHQQFVVGVKGDPAAAFARVWGDFKPTTAEEKAASKAGPTGPTPPDLAR